MSVREAAAPEAVGLAAGSTIYIPIYKPISRLIYPPPSLSYSGTGVIGLTGQLGTSFAGGGIGSLVLASEWKSFASVMLTVGCGTSALLLPTCFNCPVANKVTLKKQD